jgi:hypothetical protein
MATKLDTLIEELKNKQGLSREDIGQLLKTVGKPGTKQDEKKAAIASLGKTNFQGIGLEESLIDYSEF